MLIDEIKSNCVWVCVWCGDPITGLNYSGWEAFVEDGQTTQPICKACDFLDAHSGEKEDCSKSVLTPAGACAIL